MRSVLSTKRLSSSQKKPFHNRAIDLVEYDAVVIESIDFNVSSNIENAIFTSQNAVRSFLKKCPEIENTAEMRCFCVGSKTSALLVKSGKKVVKTTKNASELARFIRKNHKSDVYYFFCGNLRRDEIPSELKKAKIDFFEVITYKTELKPKKFEQKWDKILFFSPSGVESFLAQNSIASSVAICIGTTTASEAKKHTVNIKIAEETTIESVITKALEN